MSIRRTRKRSWGVFTNIGVADNGPSPIRCSVNAGLGGSSPISSRPLDTFGVGYSYVEYSALVKNIAPAVLPIGNDHAAELFYNYAVTPWFRLTPDVPDSGPRPRTNAAAGCSIDRYGSRSRNAREDRFLTDASHCPVDQKLGNVISVAPLGRESQLDQGRAYKRSIVCGKIGGLRYFVCARPCHGIVILIRGFWISTQLQCASVDSTSANTNRQENHHESAFVRVTRVRQSPKKAAHSPFLCRIVAAVSSLVLGLLSQPLLSDQTEPQTHLNREVILDLLDRDRESF